MMNGGMDGWMDTWMDNLDDLDSPFACFGLGLPGSESQESQEWG